MPVTKLIGEYTTKRQAPTKMRRVRSTNPDRAPYFWTQVAQKTFWQEDTRVEITIDVEEVSRLLASRAILSKRGLSTTFQGLIKAKVIGRVKHDVRFVDEPLPNDVALVEETEVKEN
ncbi:MAG: hypothetical protein RLZZ524_2363 [Pseudomonadota bacterium]|jgi:hypothetical protein